MQSADFEYLREPARKYGGMYGVTELEAFVDKVSAAQLEELQSTYAMIANRDDSFRISRWMDDSFERRHQIPKRESDFASQVGQMFVLFGYFARRGIQPFSSGKVEYLEVVIKPNWANLPKELDYLIDVAETYGVYQSETDIILFLEQAHPNDLEVLATTAERIRLNAHSKMIDEWLKRSDLQTEWSMIFYLMLMFLHAGLNVES